MFKYSIFFINFLIVFSTSLLKATDKPYIISGFDDVLRQSNNTSIVNAAIKIFEKDKSFAGMPELYRGISSQELAPNFVIVSGISSWFNNRIENFLSEFAFPSHKGYLRNWLTEWSIQDFKIRKIKESH